MTLKFYNTLTRQKEDFTPIDRSNVRFYACGPTVYDYAHIGNARMIIAFDVLFRLLRQTYGANHITYARNITDVDDKIINAAKDSGETINEVTTRTTEAFHADMASLGNLPPTVEPRATAHIPEMIALIETLLEGGHAYAQDGHVLFEVSSMEDYGKLSRNRRDEILEGARVEVAPYKKDGADFVLWKPSVDDQPGWDSPWGFGRPGWHLECSAMSEKHLGKSFDIHGGGRDLIFPHHENEIAQSCCAYPDEGFAKFWMHNGDLTVEGQKMSKSLGNVLLLRDLLGKHHGETIRYAMLKTHYRSPLDWTEAGLKEAKTELDRFYGALRIMKAGPGEDIPAGVLNALSDDLNTPLALAAIHEVASELNKAKTPEKQKEFSRKLLASGKLLGVLACEPEAWFKWQPEGAAGLTDQEIEDLIANRIAARADKEFGEADRIRDLLTANGIALEDGAEGTTWRRG